MKAHRARADGGIAPLAFAPHPVPGENLHGYMQRLAMSNGHVNMSTFLNAIGLRGCGPGSDEPHWERLCALTKLPQEAFATMRWRAARLPTGHRISFLGSQVAPGHVHPKSMRFCPKCLRGDGVRRDFWSLGKVVACPCTGRRWSICAPNAATASSQRWGAGPMPASAASV